VRALRNPGGPHYVRKLATGGHLENGREFDIPIPQRPGSLPQRSHPSKARAPGTEAAFTGASIARSRGAGVCEPAAPPSTSGGGGGICRGLRAPARERAVWRFRARATAAQGIAPPRRHSSRGSKRGLRESSGRFRLAKNSVGSEGGPRGMAGWTPRLRNARRGGCDRSRRTIHPRAAWAQACRGIQSIFSPHAYRGEPANGGLAAGPVGPCRQPSVRRRACLSRLTALHASARGKRKGFRDELEPHAPPDRTVPPTRGAVDLPGERPCIAPPTALTTSPASLTGRACDRTTRRSPKREADMKWLTTLGLSTSPAVLSGGSRVGIVV